MNVTKKLHLSFDELNSMTYGMVMDMLIERSNDEYNYRQLATQSDFDKF